MQVIDRSVAVNTQQPGAQRHDRRQRRFGYAPGIFQMQMDTNNSGWGEEVLPQGILIPFRTATVAGMNFDIRATNYVPQVDTDREAAWYVENVKAWYSNQGFLELTTLTNLEDEECYQLFEVLYEPIICSFWGDHATECASCRIASLESDGTQERMLASGLSYDHLESLRLALLDSNLTYRAYCSVEWAVKVGEVNSRLATGRGLPALQGGEHHLRKHIHVHAPAEADVLTAQASGKETAAQMKEGFGQLAEAMRERGSDPNMAAVVGAIHAQQEQTNAILQQMAEDRRFFMEMLARQSPAQAPIVEQPKKEKAK